MFLCLVLVLVASAINLRTCRCSEPREEKVDCFVEDDVASPEVNGEDDRGHDDDDGRSDHLVPARPGHLLHLAIGVADEFPRYDPPVLRSCCQSVLFHGSSVVAGQEGLEPPTCGFGDRCSTN